MQTPQPIQSQASGADSGDPAKQPELVFGLVGPLGTDLSLVAGHLKDALARVRYRADVFRLSRFMRELPALPWSDLTDGPRDDEIDTHMQAGNALRERLGRNDAVAMLGVGAIRNFREMVCQDPNRSLAAQAHILHSLKRPEEITTLRRIYGPTFFVIAAYSPRARRLQDLARRIAESRHSNQSSEFTGKAEQLLARDESEAGNPRGQDVRNTFALADVIVNTNEPKTARDEVLRFVELLFGNTFHTPTRDEQGMFFAQSAAYRSASLARQVGACVCRPDGSVVSVGSNEVARAGGGQYWYGDDPDARDFQLGYDSSDRMRENLLGDILQRLQHAGWLTEERAKLPVSNLLQDALRSDSNAFMKNAQFTGTIDFVRAVHAELAALTTAVRHGVSTQDCSMFTTTFPCHDCAKHLVASGVKRVVYIEPYPKSLVPELYPDSIAVDSHVDCQGRVRFDPFVGIAPKRYGDLFALQKRKRKNPDGTAASWQPNDALPTIPEHFAPPLARLVTEQEEFEDFKAILFDKGVLKGSEQ